MLGLYRKEEAFKIDFTKIRGVIFDVDGTLYDLNAVWREMLIEIFFYYLRWPHRLFDVKILLDYKMVRKFRSEDITEDLDNEQYIRASKVCGAPPARIRRLVDEWVLARPIRHIVAHKHPFVTDFIDALLKKGIKVGFFSDYPPVDKLEALGIKSQYAFSSSDMEINRFKPDPKGLEVASRAMGVEPHECLVIGDKDHLDAEAAKRGGFPYLLLDNGPAKKFYSGLMDSL